MSKGSVGDINVGNFLKTYFTNGIYNQAAANSMLWDMIYGKRVGRPEGKKVTFNLQTELGMSAIQFTNPQGGGSFPAGQRIAMSEGTTYFKEVSATIDIPMEVLSKEGSVSASYANSILAKEVDSKSMAIGIAMSRQVCGDGTGALGVISSVAISGGALVITLDITSANAGRSHIGNFRIGEKHLIASTAAALQLNTNSSGITSYYKVSDIDYDLDKVTLVPYSSADAALTATAANDVGAGDLIYPYFDGTNAGIPDVTSPGDYGLIGYVFPGLESLSADDGRTVNGLAMSGVLKGTRNDLSGGILDKSDFRSLMTKVQRNVGKNLYNYSKSLVNDIVLDKMIEAWEADRLVQGNADNVLGTSGLFFQHGKNKIAIEGDEFIHKKRAYILPDSKDVLQFRGTAIEPVRVGNSEEFMPDNGSGSHKKVVRKYLDGCMTLYCQHPAAIGVLEDFIIS